MAKGILAIALLVFILFAPKNTDTSGADNERQLMSIVETKPAKTKRVPPKAAVMPRPTKEVRLNYFTGFFMNPNGVMLYLNAMRGIAIVPSTKEQYIFTTKPNDGDGILLEYDNENLVPDIVREEESEGISITPQNNPSAKTDYKRIK